MFEEILILTLVWAHLGLIFGNLGAGKKQLLLPRFAAMFTVSLYYFYRKRAQNHCFLTMPSSTSMAAPSAVQSDDKRKHTHEMS
jgi:hypothetical protein